LPSFRALVPVGVEAWTGVEEFVDCALGAC
jgi:hypothetical protein